jgi:hypothetical protein
MLITQNNVTAAATPLGLGGGETQGWWEQPDDGKKEPPLSWTLNDGRWFTQETCHSINIAHWQQFVKYFILLFRKEAK